MSSPDPPSAVPLPLPLPPPPPPPSSRRPPPPCWSHDETVALIDAYRHKWYSLGRVNLKATQWQDVADAVASACPAASPSKTPIQCRHKMEKLRKRYRSEIQRARSLPLSRFNSSWLHFSRMHSLEKGPTSSPHHENLLDHDHYVKDQNLFEGFKDSHRGSNTAGMNKFLYSNGVGGSGGGSGGFRIRIPTVAQPVSMFCEDVGDREVKGDPRRGFEKKRERDPVGEMVCAIKVLGDGFVRMEEMKMDMARQIESMRMEMEKKRTEMILESQYRIVEAFANAVSQRQKNKKPKRMPSPSSQS
ncbi:hypothetical protein RJT34_14099 [Clitoria ternatea]|uniref:Myb-like domain-containing protein n=1 Tax=Clitoria ternatea TaxID=43366 RepID=A0AAN9PMV3_CLITE